MRASGSARRAAARAVKLAAAGADLLVRDEPGLVVLIYHRVGGGSASSVDLDRGLFDAQIAELSESGRLTSLDEGLARLAARDLEDRPVVITFDDGTADWVDHVLPILARHRAPATFYVATDFVDQGRTFPGGAPAISWSGLAELVASGLASVGSHTHRHVLLDRVSGPVAADELDRSIGLLQSRLGVPCAHFAYPKAQLGNPEAEHEVRLRFRSATIAGSRANHHDQDVHRLHRTPIQTLDGMRWFRRKAAGGLRYEDRARQMVDRRRYAGATT